MLADQRFGHLFPLPARLLYVLVVSLGLLLTGNSETTLAQDAARKVIAKKAPGYPELARKMHLTGKVKVRVRITPAGSVKVAKLVGGSPVFEASAVEALKQWKFEMSNRETTELVTLEFPEP